ncbi:MAG: twin-arginine translocase TatA/TatE family subunit [Deltaproteobacteria bacterium]|nr:twin-arginine translocase TatA/TatE family subunit [Deltaproteobacteria bacterium]
MISTVFAAFGLGTGELLLIFGTLLLLFGGAKLPQLGSALGSSIRNFKKGFSGEEDKQQPPQAKLEDVNPGNRQS